MRHGQGSTVNTSAADLPRARRLPVTSTSPPPRLPGSPGSPFGTCMQFSEFHHLTSACPGRPGFSGHWCARFRFEQVPDRGGRGPGQGDHTGAPSGILAHPARVGQEDPPWRGRGVPGTAGSRSGGPPRCRPGAVRGAAKPAGPGTPAAPRLRLGSERWTSLNHTSSTSSCTPTRSFSA